MYMTYGQILEYWLLEKKKEIKTSSYMNYESIVRNNITPYLSNLKIQDIEFKTILNYYKKYISHKSTSYQKTVFSIILSSLKNYKPQHQIITKFTRQHITRNTIQYEHSIFDENELNKIINICIKDPIKYKLGILIAIYTGMRIGEICALTYADIDFNQKVFKVRKTLVRIKDNTHTSLVTTTTKTKNSERIIPINNRLFRLLNNHYQESDLYILSNSKIPIDPRVLRRNFKMILNLNNIKPLRFHDLRHSFANLCLTKGIDFKCLSDLLGHANVTTTLNIYIHANMQHKHDAINKLF